MREAAALGPWIRRFLLEHLVSERNLAANTRRNYRDTMCQLLPFVSARLHKAVDRLEVVDVSAQAVRESAAVLPRAISAWPPFCVFRRT